MNGYFLIKGKASAFLFLLQLASEGSNLLGSQQLHLITMSF